MKQFKTLVALVLALALTLSLVGAAFADTETKTGSITVTNAAKGETYTIYKLFGATVNAADNNKIAYTGTIPSGLTNYFKETSSGSGYVEAKPAAYDNVVYYTDATKATESAEVTDFWAPAAGASMSSGLKTALTTWANAQTSNAGSQVGDGSPVVFDNLELGYYVVTTTQGENAISVDSTNLNAEIIDKNSTTITADKVVDDTSYNIGDWIQYTATFGTTNWIGDEQVKSYTISDTLPDFLSDVTVLSLTIVQTDDDNQKTNYPDVPLTGYSFDANKKMVIPWVTGANDDSLYKNGSQIVLVYKAKLTSTSKVGGVDNKNVVTITPNKDKPGNNPFDEHEEDDAVIKTYAAALKKTDGTNALAGAKFAFKGLTVEETGVTGVYRVVSYDATSTTLGTVMSTDNNGKLYILGLKGTARPVGNETEAPLGYNKLTSDVTLVPELTSVELWHKEETRYYDADGNLTNTVTSTSHTVTGNELNLSNLDATAVEVVNNQGSELPSTGGIGTTIFYVAGIVLVLGAAAIIIARRKAEQE